MSDALPLPPQPNVLQYKKLAKELLEVGQSSLETALHEWALQWAGKVARLQRGAIEPDVGQHVEASAAHIERRWREIEKEGGKHKHTLAMAQLVIARAHGFASWPKFAQHLDALKRENSETCHFESAVDAIVSGDKPALEALLSTNPNLIRLRSSREHRSTLLHYVSANGVEDFRQITPANIVEITKLLLNSGAAVNAESDAYGGRSTTLGLVATSAHPEKAGVQIPLLELLLDYGATIDGANGSSVVNSCVNSCLRNGRRQAAEFLANHGARLDLEGAAGVGRLDLVKTFFNAEGVLQATATTEQLNSAFAWACEFGCIDVVEYLLNRGVDVGARNFPHGQTGLHWAALGAQVGTVKLLLNHDAPVNVTDKTHDGTPLGWLLYGWLSEPDVRPEDRYSQVVSLLVTAGASVQPDWLTDPKIRSDPKMLAALHGQPPGEALSK